MPNTDHQSAWVVISACTMKCHSSGSGTTQLYMPVALWFLRMFKIILYVWPSPDTTHAYISLGDDQLAVDSGQDARHVVVRSRAAFEQRIHVHEA